MRKSRVITVVLTFLAGLYFVLDFIVPPTAPLISRQGVVVALKPATVTIGASQYELAAKDRVQLLESRRDTTGAVKTSPVNLRSLQVGSVVTLRRGPFVLAGSPTSRWVTAEGLPLNPFPGDQFVSSSTNRVDLNSRAGDSIYLQRTSARLAAIDRGSVSLLISGQRVAVPLGARTVLLKLSRFDQPSEAQLSELRVGDTVRVGPGTGFADYRDTASQFNLVISTMAFGMGLISLGMFHAAELFKRRPGWYLSAFFFGSVVLGVIAGLYKYYDPGTAEKQFSDVVVLRILAAVSSAVFSLLAFYMATAAYRAFRIKTSESAVLMITAVVVMLGQTPFGLYLTSWMGERYSGLWLPNTAAWIMRVPNTAVFRGLTFGIMLGSIATALRYWFSLERSAAMGD